MTASMTAERLRAILDYDAVTGEFRWKVGHRAGVRAGSADDRGYRRIMIDGRAYKEHRLAWLFVHGHWPPEIDHKDRNRANNRIENLRSATRSLNGANSWKRANKYGLKGVVRNTDCRQYRARIVVRGKHIVFGSFDTPEAAHAAYLEAARLHFGEFAT